MSDDTRSDDESELRGHLLRLGAAMEAAPADDRRTVIALDDAGRRRRRPTRLIGVGAGMAAAAALIIGVLVVRSPDSRPVGSTRTGDIVTNPTATTAPTAPGVVSMTDLLGYLMPATTADYNSGADMALANFLMMAGAHQDAACLRNKGWSQRVTTYFAHRSDRPRTPVPMNNSQFPDVVRLESGTFQTDSWASSTTDAMDAAIPKERRASAFADFRTCQQQRAAKPDLVGAVFSQLTGIVGTEQHPYGFDAGMESDPTYVAALADWRACMADGGVHTTSLDDFFGQVDDLKRSDLGDTAKAARTAALAKLYGHCVEPLSHVMDAYRLAARNRVVAKYRSQLEDLLVLVNREVAALEAEYGITYP